MEVDREPERLAARLVEQGLEVRVEGREVVVGLPEGTAADDHRVNQAIVAAVAELGLPLVGLARRRERLSDMFETAAAEVA